MALAGILTEIEKTGNEELSKLEGKRPLIVDGSISEILTRALNIAYSKRSKLSNNPNYGLENPDIKTAPGAFGMDHDVEIDDQYAVKPDMEGFQERHEQVKRAADKLSNAINSKEKGLLDTRVKPILIYAVPENLIVPEETKDDLDARLAVGANPKDIVITYIEDADVNLNPNTKTVDISETIHQIEHKGAKVYHSLNELLDRIEDVNKY